MNYSYGGRFLSEQLNHKTKVVLTEMQTGSILTDRLSEVFGRTKLHKKDIEIYIFLIKIVIANFRLIFQYCVSIKHLLCQILLCTNAIKKSYLKIAITFLSNQKIYLQIIGLLVYNPFKNVVLGNKKAPRSYKFIGPFQLSTTEFECK